MNVGVRVGELLGGGCRVVRCAPIGGGAAGSVSRIHFDDGSTAIAKQGDDLDREARSLRLLAEHSSLPVPRVLHAEPSLLVMTDLGDADGGGGGRGAGVETHAADLLADLHGRVSPDGRYGLEFDNLIGPLHQPNGWSDSWVEFFRERRIAHMAEHAAREGVLPLAIGARLDRLCARLSDLIPDHPAASLIHGDVWSGNVIARGGKVAGFIDPAPHFAHAEVELAFITMFGTFGRTFFDRYRDRRAPHAPLDDDFWNRRRAVYLLYPLLTHIRIYRGGGYVEQLSGALGQLGF